jgi:NADH-quinone oxidoreductase subunit H
MDHVLDNAWLRGLVHGALLITVLMTAVAWISWFERKFAARVQSRLGPTMVGPAGLLQPIADAFKMFQKEDIIPRGADAWLFRLAPPLTLALALGAAAVLPLSPGALASELDIGVLYVLAFAGSMSFPIWIAGWSSANKYALLGGMRMVAQGISYELPMALSALVPVVVTGSLSLADIVRYQAEHHWLVLWPPGIGLIAFVIFFITMLAEGNRIPFDIPEAESELVAGPTTEYTAIRFGLFASAEYVHSLVGCALASTLFLGGWDGPLLPPLFWMVAKTVLLFVLVTWIRWSLLRLRSDQLMALCWKYLVPITLGLVLIAGVMVHVEG